MRIIIIKNSPKSYGYYLKTADNAEKPIAIKDTPKTKEKYVERDLHPLLATFLNHENIYAKTIYHEESNKTDRNQKWIHPDMIGIKFIEYSNSVCQSFFMSTNKSDMVEIYSYELKREIHSDYELKQDFFQTVSNSSWANYGYLVAFDIESSLIDELKRLNNSFGIGFILLKANPFETQIVLPAKRRDLDFITIQKLCEINSKFKDIFNQSSKVITADSDHIGDSKNGLKAMCDRSFSLNSETEWKSYCENHHIPIDFEE